MGVHFPVDESYLIGTWLQGVLWGIYSILFGIFIMLWKQRKYRRMADPATIAALIMYILATIHMALCLMRMIEAFIIYRDDPGPVLYYVGATRLSITADYIYMTNMIIGDAILVWRLYVVWNRNLWATAVGISMGLGTCICGATASSLAIVPSVPFQTAVNWGTSMFVISLSTNIIVTLMVAGRIYYQAWRVRSMSGGALDMGRYRRILLIITESGTLITVAKIIEFTLYMDAPQDGLDGNNAMYIPNKCLPQITGIAPLIILIAVGTGSTGAYITGPNTYTTSPEHMTIQFRHQSTMLTTEHDGSNTAGRSQLSLELNRGHSADRVEDPEHLALKVPKVI